MLRSVRVCIVLALLAIPAALRADAFDHYINPILSKAPSAAGVVEVKQLTMEHILENDRVIPNASAALIVVRSNGGRFSKLLVQIARQKVDDKTILPIFVIERFTTYREGEERAVQAQGQKIFLFNGFTFSLDMGQVVPNVLGGDIRFVADGAKVFAEPVGKAKLYLLTKALPEAVPKKGAKLEVGETFEVRYFNGTYKLYDDGRRSGKLTLQVADDGEVTGAYYSDRDGRKYDVAGKVGTPKHSVQLTIKFPQTEESFQGWLFTGNAKALAGSAKFRDREAAFYAVRVEDE